MATHDFHHYGLRELDRALRKQVGEAEAITAGLDEADLARPPAERAWSIGQCLDHLVATADAYEPFLLRAIEGAPRGDRPNLDPIAKSWLGAWFVSAVSPQSRRRLPAPKRFRPGPAPEPGALERFLGAQETLLGCLKKADGLDLNRTKLRSPVSPLLRFRLGEAFVALSLHVDRHLAQARRVRETIAG